MQQKISCLHIVIKNNQVLQEKVFQGLKVGGKFFHRKTILQIPVQRFRDLSIVIPHQVDNKAITEIGFDGAVKFGQMIEIQVMASCQLVVVFNFSFRL